MTHYRSLNHSKWACQYHVVFIPKIPQEGDLRGAAAVFGGVVPAVGAAAGERGGRRASDGRPRQHDVVNSPEVRGGAGDRVTSKGRARSTLPGSLPGGRAALWGSTFGPAATSCPRWVGMSERFACISGRRKWKTVGKSSSGWMTAATRRVAQVDA